MFEVGLSSSITRFQIFTSTGRFHFHSQLDHAVFSFSVAPFLPFPLPPTAHVTRYPLYFDRALQILPHPSEYPRRSLGTARSHNYLLLLPLTASNRFPLTFSNHFPPTSSTHFELLSPYFPPTSSNYLPTQFLQLPPKHLFQLPLTLFLQLPSTHQSSRRPPTISKPSYLSFPSSILPPLLCRSNPSTARSDTREQLFFIFQPYTHAVFNPSSFAIAAIAMFNKQATISCQASVFLRFAPICEVS